MPNPVLTRITTGIEAKKSTPEDVPAKMRMLSFTEAIGEALKQSMRKHPEVFVMGLGATDPKGVFGTTIGLEKEFGSKRVFDMPVSENAATGVAVGAAISGMRPVMAHQRADFVLMAMDQIVNNAAKWYYMYGSEKSVALTIRTIVGKGWGQGPQHSQNFQALFAHIPGLKVVAPTTPYQAKGLLIASIEDNNPVIFIEHRWLSNQSGHVPQEYYSLPLGKAEVMRGGRDISIISSMDMTLEALHIAQMLEKEGVSIEVIDLCSVKPLDKTTLLNSAAKTGRVLILDSGWRAFGVSAEIAAVIAEESTAPKMEPTWAKARGSLGGILKRPTKPIRAMNGAVFGRECIKVRRLGLPEAPTPTSRNLAGHYYVSQADICRAIAGLLDIKMDLKKIGAKDFVSDVPDEYFKGPF